MRVGNFFKFLLIILGVACMFLSFVQFSTISKFLLLSGIALLSPTLYRGYLVIRGVKKGDTVIVNFHGNLKNEMFFHKVLGKALQNGKKGDVIEVEIGSYKVYGEIVSCGGILFPPEVNVLYYQEPIVAHEFH
ncbi:MAG: hypothetical protein DRN25_04205 [Thermoplasmata archaeon]|nr:MAG: hypothetical protein DRN25_04205 [Thermoplasmata archaeon]